MLCRPPSLLLRPSSLSLRDGRASCSTQHVRSFHLIALSFLNLNHPSFPGSAPLTSVWLSLQCESNHPLDLFPFRLTYFRTGYTEVLLEYPVTFFRSPAVGVVSCSQAFYYFQNYREKDDRGTKAVVRLGKLKSGCPILTTCRLLLPWCPTRYTRRSSLTWVCSVLISLTLATSRLEYRAPVYTYVITDYHTPQKLEYIVWYVLAESAIPLFTHSEFT